jgi:hypothetical protein
MGVLCVDADGATAYGACVEPAVKPYGFLGHLR